MAQAARLRERERRAAARAAADALVQALAPFLIVANEHVFLQYAWFYEMQVT